MAYLFTTVNQQLKDNLSEKFNESPVLGTLTLISGLPLFALCCADFIAQTILKMAEKITGYILPDILNEGIHKMINLLYTAPLCIGAFFSGTMPYVLADSAGMLKTDDEQKMNKSCPPF